MNKIIKFPNALISGDCATNSLVLDGGSVIDQCIVTAGQEGTFFLEQHLLYVVLGGSVSLDVGKQTFVVHKNEMVLLRKAGTVHYVKTGDPETGLFESLLFAIKDGLLSDFLTQQDVKAQKPTEELGTRVSPMNDKLVAYCWSLAPYFNEPDKTTPGLLRLKVMELLYDVAECSRNIFNQMLQLRQPVHADVHRVVEEYYTTPASLDDLAYLSGRSLSSFKRDFMALYHEPPARWIRRHRLDKAREMLSSTSMSVSDVCYSLGFENPTHFSRIFKERFGIAPSALHNSD